MLGNLPVTWFALLIEQWKNLMTLYWKELLWMLVILGFPCGNNFTSMCPHSMNFSVIWFHSFTCCACCFSCSSTKIKSRAFFSPFFIVISVRHKLKERWPLQVYNLLFFWLNKAFYIAGEGSVAIYIITTIRQNVKGFRGCPIDWKQCQIFLDIQKLLSQLT